MMFGLLGIATAAEDGRQLRDPGLSVSKAVYEQKVQDAERESFARQYDLDSAYTTTLKTRLKVSQDNGELEPLLAIKSEAERFAKDKTVLGKDAVSFPPELAEAQRQYMTARYKITKDRQLKMARAAQAYLDDLIPAKRSLTKIGEIDSAVAVNDEIKRVKSSVDLSVLEQPAVEATPVQAATAPVAPPQSAVVANPPGLRPLRDYIWVYALRNGLPVRDVSFTFVPSGANKTVEMRTDQMGRISLLTEPGHRYHIVHNSEKYEFLDVTSATAGNTYQFQLADARPGSGIVYVKSQQHQVFLPGAGEVTVAKWKSPEGKPGLSFYAGGAVFRTARNPKSTGSSAATQFGEPFRILDAEREYEATPYHIGPGETYCVRYSTVK